MLFNSKEFLVYFLPIVLAVFFAVGGSSRYRLAAVWLVAASLVFYGWWYPPYVPLLMASMVANFLIGRRLARAPSKYVLGAGVAANILLLGVYKYSGFAVTTSNQLFGLDWVVPNIALPLAISFFTFQQIAFLADAHDGNAEEHSFVDYSLFITFFPHLIAGPITHHREMLPQFRNSETFRPRLDNVAIGATLFVLGLFKKVAIADPLGEVARPIFAEATTPALSLIDAWGGALAYALQIYFDFSGYTDMAIGLGLMFGIRLPPNFDSPYKARNIIEFWSRFHMTLTRFLTAYVYNPIVLRVTRARLRAGLPLGGRSRTTPGAFVMMIALPTILTMFISGVWHGAGWQFIIFGLLHGLYITINRAWRTIKGAVGWPVESKSKLRNASATILTFLCVVVALVFFRSSDVPSAIALLSVMMGSHGVGFPPGVTELPGLGALSQVLGIPVIESKYLHLKQIFWIVVVLAVVWGTPNTQQWMRHYRTALDHRPRMDWVARLIPRAGWQPTSVWGLMIGCLATYALMRTFSQAPTEFLYFQF
ncbi:MAG: MBOAT family protein [Bradyrhizobium sp.]|uniref:MBOAT family O-acyltransferase n=1 Tax=Bradyrhizobium sp. TaxID=376 RepID=UPI0025BBDF6B|nr:MBOAT family O-acyltransferase [Bradyrhizobium sp.]MBI5265039.1 MBOAT family protein [Bradyrhizobium sp.]